MGTDNDKEMVSVPLAVFRNLQHAAEAGLRHAPGDSEDQHCISQAMKYSILITDHDILTSLCDNVRDTADTRHNILDDRELEALERVLDQLDDGSN